MINTDSLLLTQADGAEVAASLFLPHHLRRHRLPAGAGRACGLLRTARRALADRGFTVATVDLRGNGRSNVRPGRGVDFGYGLLVADAAATVRLYVIGSACRRTCSATAWAATSA